MEYMSKPFLVLTSRPDGNVLASEMADLPRISGMNEGEWVQIRIEEGVFPEVNFSEWSGAIICGSPWDASAHPEAKSAEQLRGERWLSAFYQRALAEEFPLIGLCYGLGTLNLHMGGCVDDECGEEISAVEVTKTQAGLEDPLLEGTPDSFYAYVGHHEAVSVLAPNAQVLMEGRVARVQMARFGRKAWATQFHPELDRGGVDVRINEYGGRYYPQEQAEAIRAQTHSVDVSAAHVILKNFVRLHRR